MPKLNATIDQIELKTNRVTGTVPSSSWTDAQYPSAKALYNAYNKLLNIAHPIGSVITTTTNTNPGSGIGGTWVLVDKAFKTQYNVLDSSCWTKANANLIYNSDASTVAYADHVINIRLKVETTAALSDTNVKLGTLNFAKLGIERLFYSVLYGTAQSDGGQCTINYSVDYETGEITVHDVLNVDGTHTMAAGETFFININEAVSHSMMLDSFCYFFYWIRTA